MSDLWDGLIHEYSALVDKDRLFSAYKAAVSEPYGFLYINLLAKDIDHMFYSGFNKRFVMTDAGEDEQSV